MEFRDRLRMIEDMTEEQLMECMRSVPEEVRARLAKGPVPYRFDCGVCEAFGRGWIKQTNFDEGLEDPVVLAFLYHEIPKKDMRNAEQQWYGKLANDVYNRCIATYRAAGWDGEAKAANA